MNLRTLRRRSIALLLAFAVVAPSASSAQAHFPRDEDLVLMLRYLVEDGETPGIVLGVLEADGSTRVVSYGSAGPGTRPLGPRSVFEIGSITKTFTGTILAHMVARGEVALADPVYIYLPGDVKVPSYDGREITLLDLATHTSGLPPLPDNHRPVDMQDPYADYPVETMYAFLSGHELRRAPGAEFEYSNLGFGILGHALARAAGTSFKELLRQRVLEPLGMDMTGYGLEGELADWMTRGHAGGETVPYWFTTEAIDGAGGPRSDAEDMLRYLQANLGPAGTPLERAMRTAQEPRRPMGQGDRMVGLAWQSFTLNGRPIVMHGGSTGGFSTQIAFDPEKRVGVVVLTNDTRFGDNLGTDLIVHEPPPENVAVVVEPDALASYAGHYALASGVPMYVRIEDDGFLTIQAPMSPRIRLYAESDTSFFAKREEWRVTFSVDEAGVVVGLVLDWNGREQRYARVGSQIPPSPVVAGNAFSPVSTEEVARYAGTYLLEIGGRKHELRIFGGDDGLMAEPQGQGVTPLVSEGEHAFVFVVNPGIRLVFSLENGRADSVTLHQGGGTWSGARIR
jgi:CubicO group peptidase (beta-lactamase class C family)